MSNPSVSAVLIVKNEESNIRRALKSLTWADEIIVLDTGSVDNTVHICREMGVRVDEHEWHGYVDAKNTVSNMASSDWIFSLDADEEVTPELREEILQTVNDSSAKSGYRIPRKNHYLGRWIRYCGWYPDLQLRLWKRGKGCWVGGRVHERVDVDGPVDTMKSAMNHFTYASLAEHIERMNRYAGLYARDNFEAGKRTSALALFLIPPWQFFRLYFLRLGCLDGVHGLLVSALGAYYGLLKKARLWEIQKRAKRTEK